MNQCIHYTDLLQWMFGDADEVFAYTDRLTHPYIEAEDMGLALIRFKNGAYATVEGTVNVYPNNLSDALAVFGETGTVSVSGKYLDQVERWQFENGTDSLPGAIEKYAVADMGTGPHAALPRHDRRDRTRPRAGLLRYRGAKGARTRARHIRIRPRRKARALPALSRLDDGLCWEV